MTDPDRLPEIKARSQKVHGLPWRWSRDERPHRFLIEGKWVTVGIVETQQDADFIVAAPYDIDWLVGEVERLRQGDEFSRMHAEMVGLHKGFEAKEAEVEELSERLAAAQVTIGQLSHERARLREGFARLEWNRDGRCNGCNGFQWTVGHDSECWLAALLRPERP